MNKDADSFSCINLWNRLYPDPSNLPIDDEPTHPEQKEEPKPEERIELFEIKTEEKPKPVPPPPQMAHRPTGLSGWEILPETKSLDHDYLIKVVFFGESQVGKSSFIKRAIENEYAEELPSTIGVDFRIVNMKTDCGKVLKVQAWDMAGQQRFRAITTAYIRGAQVMFLCFDLTDRNSFSELEFHIQNARSHNSDVMAVLIGTKSDRMEEERMVSSEQVREFMAKYELEKDAYFEVSSLTGENVLYAFQYGIKMAFERAHRMCYCSSSSRVQLEAMRSTAVAFSEPKMGAGFLSLSSKKSKSQTPDTFFTDLQNMFNTLGLFFFRIFPARPSARSKNSAKLRPLDLAHWLIYLSLNPAIYLFSLGVSVALSVGLVLPSFFAALVFRTAHTEHDTSQFSDRQNLLQTETMKQKSGRWVALVLKRSLPVALVLILFPSLSILGFEPGSQRSTQIVYAYLAIVMGLVVLGTVRNGAGYIARVKLEQKKSKNQPEAEQSSTSSSSPPAKINWRKPANFAVLISLIIEFAQLSVLSTPQRHKAATQESTKPNAITLFVQNVAPALFLTFSENSALIAFWCAFGAVCALLIVFSHQLLSELRKFGRLRATGQTDKASDYFFYSLVGSVVFGHASPKNIPPRVSLAFSLLCDTLLLIVCDKLLRILPCENGAAFSSPNLTCFGEVHSVASVLSLIALGYYLPLSTMVSPILVRSSQNKNDVKYEDFFIMLTTTSKCLLVILSILLSPQGLAFTAPLVSFLSCLFLLCAIGTWMATTHSWKQPCNVGFVNLLRLGSFGSGVASAIVWLCGVDGEVVMAALGSVWSVCAVVPLALWLLLKIKQVL